MKHLIVYFFALLLVTSMLTSFKSDTTSNDPVKLRVIMRNMLNKAGDIKEDIIEGKSQVKFDYNQQSILTAPSRNKRVLKKEFQFLGKAYLKQLDQFNSSSKANKKKEFNLLIDNCINCHEEVCKGPIRRIKKLYINE